MFNLFLVGDVGETMNTPFIIAEIGSNWRTLDDCKNAINMAKACGADAVKFQLFNPKSLWGFESARDWAIQTDPETYGGFTGFFDIKHEAFESVTQASLPIEWLPILKAKADKVGIEFMCTAFSPELYDVVNPYVNYHKVASAECTHVEILEKVKSYGKPVFLSTGAHGVSDIGTALGHLDRSQTTLLYCVANYPAQEVDLGVIPAMRDVFNLPVGYSDHTTDVLMIPGFACEFYGATVLEKHVSFIDAGTPDKPHSLNGQQFKRMVEYIRNPQPPRLGYTREENPMVLRHNRRLVATKPIKAGDKLIKGENFGIYRSLKDDTNGWSPFMIDAVNGSVAVRDIQAGNGVGPGDI